MIYTFSTCVCVFVGVCVTSWDCIPAWENQWDQCNRDQSISICTHAHTHPSHRHISTSPHTYIHTICTHFLTLLHTYTLLSLAPLHSLCTQSRILMRSLRALLSVCVTFHPSTHHFQPHHQIEWKQFSTNSPFIQWFIQSSHRLKWHSTSSTFHHLRIIMRHYAALLYVSLYNFIPFIYPAFHVEWNIILKLECTSLRQGIHWQKISSLGTSAFICTRGICVCVCVWGVSCPHARICKYVRYKTTEERGERWSVCARSFTRAHQPEVDYHGVSGN